MVIKELDSKEELKEKKDIEYQNEVDKIFNEYIKKLRNKDVVNNKCDKYGHLID